MKILFDQNLSWKTVKAVIKKFPESKHVISLGLSNASDKEIWDYAKKHEYIICSKDSDFHQLNFLYGAPPKVIWLKVGNISTDEIIKILKNHLDQIVEFNNSKETFLIIQTD